MAPKTFSHDCKLERRRFLFTRVQTKQEQKPPIQHNSLTSCPLFSVCIASLIKAHMAETTVTPQWFTSYLAPRSPTSPKGRVPKAKVVPSKEKGALWKLCNDGAC